MRILSFLIALLVLGCGASGLEEQAKTNPLTLKPLILGRLYNAYEGIYVEQALIQVDDPNYQRVYTDIKGNFSLGDLPPGEYRISASKGVLLTSVEVNTKSTDFVSLNMQFGDFLLNPDNIAFREDGIWVGKKIKTTAKPGVYDLILSGVIEDFESIQDLVFNPVTSEEVLFAGRKTANGLFSIYRHSLDTRTCSNTSTQCLELVYSHPNQNVTRPNYSPTAKKLSFLVGDQIFINDLVLPILNPRALIRDSKLILRNQFNEIILYKDLINEGLSKPTFIPIIPSFQSTAQVNLNRFWDEQLNQYFCNSALVNNLPTCNFVFNQNTTNAAGTLSHSSFFNAENTPAFCPMSFKEPTWLPSGNLIAFLARPTGCAADRPNVCLRPCDDSATEIFVSPVDSDLSNLAGSGASFTTTDFLALDKFRVMQVTNDRKKKMNLVWDQMAKWILYDQEDLSTGIPRYFLSRVFPEPLIQGFVLSEPSPQPFQADISADGKKIIFIASTRDSLNLLGLPQIYSADWSGAYTGAQAITSYLIRANLSQPKFYRIQELYYNKYIPEFQR